MTDAADKTFLGVEEAARDVGISHWTIRSWLSKGLLTRYKSGARVVIERAELLQIVQPRLCQRDDNQIQREERHDKNS